MGKFLWAMTREHHPDLSLDQIAGIQFSKDGPRAWRCSATSSAARSTSAATTGGG
jgi:hypothetical protein